MFYDPSVLHAFDSIIYINNELYYGWWIRALHANGASWFFFAVYVHMFRGLYYGSFLYPRQFLWLTGSLIWVLMIATAFLGYVLPWGQMSFWAAMVITSLLGAIPLIGPDIVFLLWGGFTIEDATLHRFFSLHFFLPFVILALSIVHLLLLHEFGSSNPLGINSRLDFIPLLPYYGLKDAYFIVLIFWVFFFIVFRDPDLLGHAINYILANFLVTPPHIVPEWYFLPVYAVLRAVTNKLLGILLIAFFILSVFMIPFVLKGSIQRSGMFKPFFKIVFWFFVIDCLLLGWIGCLPVVEPFITLVNFTLLFIL